MTFDMFRVSRSAGVVTCSRFPVQAAACTAFPVGGEPGMQAVLMYMYIHCILLLAMFKTQVVGGRRPAVATTICADNELILRYILW